MTIVWHNHSITRQQREVSQGHKGAVLWFSGLSGSGKSTIANQLEQILNQQGVRTYILDGDNIRHGLNQDLGFSDQDRVENLRRVSEVASLMCDAGIVVLTAFISPFKMERERVKKHLGEDYIEVFVDTPLSVCEARDPKGLYKKARAGELTSFTGIDSPFEAPTDPDIHIVNHDTPPQELTDTIIETLIERDIIAKVSG